MNRINYGAAIASVAVLASCADSSQTTSRPNVVMIFADDIGFGDLSCYGTGVVPTPNVDRLAERGVRLTNAHTTSATSTPSRFGIFTGVYPWRYDGTGIAAGDAGMIIKPERYTVADAARSVGYRTGAIGKWHLGLGVQSEQDWNGLVTPNLTDIGFEYSYIMAATGDRVPCVFIENGRVDGYDPDAPISVSYKTPFEGEPLGRTNPELLTKLHPSHGHDQAIVNGISRIGYMKGGGKALWRDEDIPDNITDKALEFIETSGDQPFFLYFGTNDIHVPRVPHERFAGKSGLGARGDALLSFDDCVGRVLDKLDELGIADNTIVIISSDNGPVLNDGYKDQAVELLGDHRPSGDYRGGKYSSYEAGTRVPMIVYWAGRTKSGVVSDEAFSHVDLLATIAGITGAEIPSDVKVDSRCALPTFVGESGFGREYILEQNAFNNVSILQGDWKLVPAYKGIFKNKTTNTEIGNMVEDQLYDISKDKNEQVNVASTNLEKVMELRSILDMEFEDGVGSSTLKSLIR